MSPRTLARLSLGLGFTGFFGLLGVWAVLGGRKGSEAYALAALGWAIIVFLFQQFALRCPSCQREIYESQDVPWPVPVKCGGCGKKF